MDPVLNPYTPGAGTRPRVLAGRDEQIARFDTVLKRLLAGSTDKGIMLTGLRGVGKTVLLNTFRDQAEAHGYRTADVEVNEESNFTSFFARMTRRVLIELSPPSKLAAGVRRALGVLKAFSLRFPDGPEIAIDVEAAMGTADSGDLAEDIPELLLAVGEAAAEESSGVAYFFDELHYLSRQQLAALIAGAHRTAQRELPVAIVGAGLPQLPGVVGAAKSYAERLFEFPHIDSLPHPDSLKAILEPAAALDVEFEPEAADYIVDSTEGYPYFLQEFGKHVWNLAGTSPITLEDVEQADPRVEAALDESFFKVRIWRTTPAERRYMRAMADIGRGPYRSSEIADRLRRKMTSVAPTRSNLIHKGLIFGPEYGVTAFTVPHFDRFLRRIYPVL